MTLLISLLILVLVVAIAFWIINQISWPSGLEIVGMVLKIIIAVAALYRLYYLIA